MQFFKNQIQQYLQFRMKSQRTEQLINYLSRISIQIFLLTIFPFSTLVLFWCTYFLLKHYLTLKFHKLLENGIIVYLPRKLQKQLMERSLFDILCDFWFIKRTNILNILFKPFFISIKPDDAAELLQQLDPKLKKKLVTKGIINLLPYKLKKIFVPFEKQQNHEPEDYQQNEFDQKQLRKRGIKKKYTISSEQEEDTKNKQQKKKSVICQKKFQEDLEQEVYQRGQRGQQRINNHQKQEKIIIQKQKQPQKWDRLELYQNLKINSSPGEKLTNMMKTFKALKNILDLKYLNPKNISYSKLTTLFIFFIFILYFQFRLDKSKQNRKLVRQIIFIVLSAGSVIGIITSILLLLYKSFYSENESTKKKFLKEN